MPDKPQWFAIELLLQLWSDEDLDPAIDALALDVRHRHIPGLPMAAVGPLAEKIAIRHYAGLGRLRTKDWSAASAWLSGVVEKLEAVAFLLDGLRSARAEGSVLIAVFGQGEIPAPAIAPNALEEAAAMNVSVRIEDYADWDHVPYPNTIWLAGGPAMPAQI